MSITNLPIELVWEIVLKIEDPLVFYAASLASSIFKLPKDHYHRFKSNFLIKVETTKGRCHESSVLSVSTGKKHGICIQTNENGTVREFSFRRGKKHGLFTEWFKGNLTKQGLYVNGKKQGVWKKWWNEKKIEEGVLENGVRHGVWKGWNENGSREWEGRYINGKKNGVWKNWYYKDKLALQCIYADGVMVSEICHIARMT